MGTSSVIIGHEAGLLTNAAQNIFIGKWAGKNSNATGSNLFIGTGSGYSTSGNSNTFLGNNAGFSNTTGTLNVFVGDGAGLYTRVGSNNAILGYQAGYGASTYSFSNNSFFGYQSGYANRSGGNNTFIGYRSGYGQTTGANNIFIGYQAHDAAIDYSNSIVVGYNIDATADNQVRLGNGATASFYCYGIYAATLTGPANVVVDNFGQLARVSSSRRYKTNITDLDVNTNLIYKLRPVSFNSIADGSKHFGLIAEEVAEHIPQLAEWAKEKDVIPGSQSEELIPESVKYPILSVLLLKEVQKHEQIIQEQNQTIVKQENTINGLQQEVNELKAKMEEVLQAMNK
jgi:hypothetical protein